MLILYLSVYLYITYTYVMCLLTDITIDPSNKTNMTDCHGLKKQYVEKHLSTKTPYRAIANLNDKPKIYKGCHATRIWSIIRHGTRNPSKDVIKKVNTVLMHIKGRILSNTKVDLCPKYIEDLKYWKFNTTLEEEKFLVSEGEDELIELAERMQNRYPSLLPNNYHPSVYHFKYTATQRTLKSAHSFAAGLLGGRHQIKQIIYGEPLRKDPILRFYKLCNRWRIEVDKNPQTFDNVRKFLEGKEMLTALKHVQMKIHDFTLNVDDIRLIYTVCAFETAWKRHQNEPSVWCQLFNNYSLKILEFAEDLEYYWNDGYGYELTQRIACPTIGDLFKHLEPRSSLPNATFYFTHSGTLLKLLAHLGLYKDEFRLTHNVFHEARNWRTSLIDSFATNLAFILYECHNLNPMVLTLHQERVIHIPGCPTDFDLCSLKTMRELFSDSIENCKFHEMCFKS